MINMEHKTPTVAILHSEDLIKSKDFFKDFYNSVETGLQAVNPVRMSLRKWYKNKDSLEFDLIAIIGIAKPANIRGFYSEQVIKEQSKGNGRCLIMERGYIGDREKYWSIGFDGLNGRADFKNENMPKDRFDLLDIKLKKRGSIASDGAVLFSLQLPWDSAVSHVWYPEVVHDVVKKILDTSDKKIVLRKHPLYDQRRPKAKDWKYKARVNASFEKSINICLRDKRVSMSQKKDLRDDLVGRVCLVTFNSNSAVEAMISGTPSIVLDEGSMIYDLSHRSVFEVDSLHTGTTIDFRKQKLYDIAYAQWNNEEIAEGKPFRHLGIF